MRAAAPAAVPVSHPSARRTVAELVSFALALLLELLFGAGDERRQPARG
jgi:hypothetical protein